MLLVLIVLVVGSATVVLVPRIASEMADSYRRAIIESAWRTTNDKLRLTLRNPGWITCRTAKKCELRGADKPDGPVVGVKVRHLLREFAERFDCGPSGKPNYCRYGIRGDEATPAKPRLSLNEPDATHEIPYIHMEIFFDTAVPDELRGKVSALPVVLNDIRMDIKLPRGVVVTDEKKFLCNGFLMGYAKNGDPICKNITTTRQGIGRYITQFEPDKMDQDDSLQPDQVPEMVRDCYGGDSFLLNYKWLYSTMYEAKCGTRVKPWLVN